MGKVKNIMKLQVLFSAAVTAVTISKPHANNFLQRFRRANEGYFSELTSGNLERECVEETCDQTEFYEVYDDDEVSAPLYTVYLDCKNYIRWDKDDQLSINSLRDCLIERQHNKFNSPPPKTPFHAIVDKIRTHVNDHSTAMVTMTRLIRYLPLKSVHGSKQTMSTRFVVIDRQ